MGKKQSSYFRENFVGGVNQIGSFAVVIRRLLLEVAIMKIMQRKFLPYLKMVLLYGAILTVIYCPSIQHDSINHNFKFGVVEEKVPNISYNNNNNNHCPSYEFNNMLILFSRCRELERQFFIGTSFFVKSKDNAVQVMELLKQLKEERCVFFDHIRKFNTYNRENKIFLRKELSRLRYHSRIIDRFIKRLNFINQRLVYQTSYKL